MTKAVCTCTDQKNKASVLNRNAKLVAIYIKNCYYKN
jgi:hypothetical protein